MTLTDYSNLNNRGGGGAVGELYYLGGANNASGYSIASFNGATNLLWAATGGQVYGTTGTLGLRPIVVLNSNVGATVANGQWQLELVNRSVEDEDSNLSDRLNGKVSSALAGVESLYY